jgi:hypothetical protein
MLGAECGQYLRLGMRLRQTCGNMTIRVKLPDRAPEVTIVWGVDVTILHVGRWQHFAILLGTDEAICSSSSLCTYASQFEERADPAATDDDKRLSNHAMADLRCLYFCGGL